MIFIVDFGSQVTQLIARRVREAEVYCEIVSSRSLYRQILNRGCSGIVFSGGQQVFISQILQKLIKEYSI